MYEERSSSASAKDAVVVEQWTVIEVGKRLDHQYLPTRAEGAGLSDSST